MLLAELIFIQKIRRDEMRVWLSNISPGELRDMEQTISEINLLHPSIFQLRDKDGGSVSILMSDLAGVVGVELLSILLRRLKRFQG